MPVRGSDSGVTSTTIRSSSVLGANDEGLRAELREPREPLADEVDPDMAVLDRFSGRADQNGHRLTRRDSVRQFRPSQLDPFTFGAKGVRSDGDHALRKWKAGSAWPEGGADIGDGDREERLPGFGGHVPAAVRLDLRGEVLGIARELDSQRLPGEDRVHLALASPVVEEALQRTGRVAEVLDVDELVHGQQPLDVLEARLGEDLEEIARLEGRFERTVPAHLLDQVSLGFRSGWRLRSLADVDAAARHERAEDHLQGLEFVVEVVHRVVEDGGVETVAPGHLAHRHRVELGDRVEPFANLLG